MGLSSQTITDIDADQEVELAPGRAAEATSTARCAALATVIMSPLVVVTIIQLRVAAFLLQPRPPPPGHH